MSECQPEAREALRELAFGAYLRQHSAEILRAWRQRAHEVAPGSGAQAPALAELVEQVLAHVAGEADRLATDDVPPEADPGALVRPESLSLENVLLGCSILRDCILTCWGAHRAGDARGAQVLERAIARSVAAAVEAPRARPVDSWQALPPEQRRLIAVLADAVPLLVTYVDADLRYRFNNGTYESWLGIRREEARGKHVREVVGESAYTAVEPYLRAALAGRTVTYRKDLTFRNGHRRYIEATYMPDRGADGSVVGFVAIASDISEVKRIEADLRERELQLRALADNIPQHAWMAHEDGSIFWYNRRWYDFTGTTFEQVRGWGWRSVHHPDHVERVVEKIRRHFRAGEVWEDTFPLRRRDGTYRWFLSRAVPIRDEDGRVQRWLGTHTDVTDQIFLKEATAELVSSLDYRATLARIAKLAVPAMADWFGVDIVTDARTGAFDRLAVEHVDPVKVALVREMNRRFPSDPEAMHGVPHVLRTGEPELYEDVPDRLLVVNSRDAEHLAFARSLGLRSAMIVPMVAHGQTVGAISFVAAESGRTYTRRDLELASELASRAALALDNARLYREAQEATRAREAVLAVVSHDLRNPVNAIGLSAAVMLQATAEDDARARKQLVTIQRSARRMKHLIGDLLDLANIQAGRLAVSCDVHDAQAVLHEAIELNEPLATRQGMGIDLATTARGARLYCDRDRVLQVFANLFDNAIKFGCAGDRITVRAAVHGGEAHVSVIDAGPGIAAGDLPRLFEPYWSRDRAGKSSGLGLFIAKGIVEAHGGTIRAESTEGAGTTFHFTLPLADDGGRPG